MVKKKISKSCGDDLNMIVVNDKNIKEMIEALNELLNSKESISVNLIGGKTLSIYHEEHFEEEFD